MLEQRDSDVGDEGTKDTIQGVEDKLQDEKGNPEGQYDQNSCKNLCPEMFQYFFCHVLDGINSRILFRSASSTTSFSSKRRASSPILSFLAVNISLTLR